MNAIKDVVTNLSYQPSLTADVWSDFGLQHAYLGVTLHCVNLHKRHLTRFFLGLTKLHGNHTGELIHEKTEEVLQRYNLKLADIYKIVSDNGSNMIRAFKHDTEDFEVGQSDYVEIDDELFIDSYGSDLDVDNDITSIDSCFTENVAINTNMFKRISCFAHSLQLCVMKFLKEYVEHTTGFSNMCKLIGRVKKSVSAIQAIKKEAGKNLIAPSNTPVGFMVSCHWSFCRNQ